MTTEKPTARDVKGHLDDAGKHAGRAMAGIWGALEGTAPADRWERAAAGLRAASEALAKAQAALEGMEKPEPYCDVCGDPILRLSAAWSQSDGWSHFLAAGDGGVEPRDAGHEAELDWRQAGEVRGG